MTRPEQPTHPDQDRIETLPPESGDACRGCGEPSECEPCEFCGYPNEPKGTAQIGWRNFGNPFKAPAGVTGAGERVDTLPPPPDKRCATCQHWNAHAVTPQVLDGICYASAKADSPIEVVSDGTVGGTWLETREGFWCALWEARET